MKRLYFLAAIFCAALFACSKTARNKNTTLTGEWQLLQEQATLTSTGHVTTLVPAADSSVYLTLKPDSTYISQLNAKTVAQGTYFITSAQGYNPTQTLLLNLNSFSTTGIFQPVIFTEIGPNNQVISVTDGMGMSISNDTLVLSSWTYDNSVAFTFLKK